ncbi:MAG: hypothetical protein K2M34_01685 [Alphaproteobacteria bacterium]|nr:hypothetical protein [Alphaproteobacteria bacterium]
MLKILVFICQLFCLISASGAASVQSSATQTSAYNYNYMYPYMNNQMRTELNPGTTTSQNLNPINIAVRTENYGSPRRVVSRSAARSGTGSGNAGTARAATQQSGTAARAAAAPTNTQQSRRIVARSATNGGGAYQPRGTARSARGDASFLAQAAENAANNTSDSTTAQAVSSARCLADYTECMNGYCERKNTAYNRCYCSAKLAQIDSQYQSDIENLIQQIIRLQNTNYWTNAEMNEYWMSIVGKYRGENSWTKLDDALNIDWVSTESRVRGQQAFATGHEYCVQHLRNCQYMSSNLRDAYRSEISRDCQTYENALQKIKTVAESLVESYQ